MQTKMASFLFEVNAFFLIAPNDPKVLFLHIIIIITKQNPNLIHYC